MHLSSLCVNMLSQSPSNRGKPLVHHSCFEFLTKALPCQFLIDREKAFMESMQTAKSVDGLADQVG